jgi:hypothetical protein
MIAGGIIPRRTGRPNQRDKGENKVRMHHLKT